MDCDGLVQLFGDSEEFNRLEIVTSSIIAKNAINLGVGVVVEIKPDKLSHA